MQFSQKVRHKVIIEKRLIGAADEAIDITDKIIKLINEGSKRGHLAGMVKCPTFLFH